MSGWKKISKKVAMTGLENRSHTLSYTRSDFFWDSRLSSVTWSPYYCPPASAPTAAPTLRLADTRLHQILTRPQFRLLASYS